MTGGEATIVAGIEIPSTDPTELQFGVGTCIALQTKINWRTRHDSNV
jgi:hypothetical protein